jgi:hypothetical protein
MARTPFGEAVVDTESTTPEEAEDAKDARAREEETLALARKRFHTAVDAYEHFRTEALDDTRFRVGTWGSQSYQWHPGIQQKREAADRPCLTINRAPGFVRQVTNQARQAHLTIQVNPVDDQSDPKIAEVLQGIIHNIEASSFADRAYAMASDKQAEIGFGVFRLITEYADQTSFRQVIKIKRERNPLAIFIDPAAQEADFSDAQWAFKVTDVDTATWKTITGKDDPPEPASLEAFDPEGTETGEWFPNGKIRIVEYFSRETVGPKRRIALLSDGRTIDYPSALQQRRLQALGITIKRDRYVQDTVTMWRKMDAVHIHEETIWKADTHPFIVVLGDEYEIDGERDFRGVIRDSKESGRIYNVEVSALVESVSLGQKAPVVGYRGQFGAPDSKMRKAWETANTQPHAFLEVEPMDIDGKNAPIPQRVPMETNLQGIVLAIHQSDEDYKTTAGFRDASLGERGPQESGKAILARQKQDELGSSHYLDNLRFALCAAGKQLIQLIRVVYDEPTVLRITGKDEKTRKVMVYSGKDKDPRQPQYLDHDPQTGQLLPFQLPHGVTELYDLSVGQFDVEVSATPSSGTRRQQMIEAMTSLLKELPAEMSAKFLDLYFAFMDVPGAEKLEARAKKLLPPALQADEDTQIPPHVQQQMEQMKKQYLELVQHYKAASEALRTEKVKTDAQAAMKRDEYASKERMNQDELDTKERIAVLNQRAELLQQQIKIKGQAALAVLEAELDRMLQTQTLHHERRLAELAASEQAADRAVDQQQHAVDTSETAAMHAIDTLTAGAPAEAAPELVEPPTGGV